MSARIPISRHESGLLAVIGRIFPRTCADSASLRELESSQHPRHYLTSRPPGLSCPPYQPAVWYLKRSKLGLRIDQPRASDNVPNLLGFVLVCRRAASLD